MLHWFQSTLESCKAVGDHKKLNAWREWGRGFRLQRVGEGVEDPESGGEGPGSREWGRGSRLQRVGEGAQAPESEEGAQAPENGGGGPGSREWGRGPSLQRVGGVQSPESGGGGPGSRYQRVTCKQKSNIQLFALGLHSCWY